MLQESLQVSLQESSQDMTHELLVQADRSQYSLPRAVGYLIAILLVISLAFAPGAQQSSLENSADDSFGSALVLQKKISSEDGCFPLGSADADACFDALLASTVHVFAIIRSSISTTRHLAASYLATFSSAAPRAPPLHPFV